MTTIITISIHMLYAFTDLWLFIYFYTLEIKLYDFICNTFNVIDYSVIAGMQVSWVGDA